MLHFFKDKCSMQFICNASKDNDLASTYRWPASWRLSDMAVRSALSRSNTPHVAWSTESSRQSPADRFHSACSLDPSLTVTSSLQLMMSASDSSSFWASRSKSSEYSCS